MDVNAGLARNFLAKSLPDLFMRRRVRQTVGQVKSGKNDFVYANELRTLLLGYNVISFDYFDTLASRSISLNALQDLTARHGAKVLARHSDDIPEHLLSNSRRWFQERLKAYYESLAHDRYRNEVDLRDLFDRVLRPYLADASQRAEVVDELVGYEVDLEKLVLETHDDFRDLLKFLKDNGKTIILTSDMYLSRDDLIEITTAQGLRPYFDHVFVSATTGVTKNSGLLFNEIDRELGFTNERRIHLGDNLTNDFTRPREFGWDARRYFQPKREAHRRTLEMEYRLGECTEKKRFDRFLSSYLGKSQPDAQRLMAASFAVFVRRVVARAQQTGVDAIYFLTRDGTIYGEIVKDFLSSFHGRGLLQNVKLKTLALNRRTGVLLEYPGIIDRGWMEHNVRYFNNTPVSLRTIMQTFGVQTSEVEGLSDDEQRLVESCLVTPQVRDMDMDELDAHPNIRDGLDRALHHKRQKAIRYLEQQGILNPDRSFLFVDVGYSGTILKNLSRYFSDTEFGQHTPIENTGARLELCMFASNRFLSGNYGQLHPKCQVSPGMVINTDTKEGRAASVNFSWLEPFCLDRTLGSLNGYQGGEKGTMDPVFGEGRDKPETDTVRAQLLAAARDYYDLSVKANLSIERLDAMIVEKMLHSFVCPTSQTVTLVRELLHDTGNSETNLESSVQKVRWFRVRRDISRVLSEDKWAQGSLRHSRVGWLIPLFNWAISRAYR
ncbi:haloacid dehalogenase superfamily, subfamily IA, variant 1 with third motif having Dx(3-4)D or Dx(3-4)E [Aliiroseovarius halocynthiae]|uniref:HAD family hydrolase n=1 Tax=Aliiroseovarius halocynthiae TaxID=985055 RepID=A0A545SYC5_9RHOB|nr:HAD family hydrolase [Aliiroseovarius halocynthiae]TQV69963.1 hypothetical protein FIL88_00895 [Aliiroseovarius halocynthiae]SMR70626.1 haloacid dehalogenase superfamily, subfamily IA, variant 1 with third motif having Dx(3-4)D or Dx(3-4)E [Aliiroseovarius halocynthiae]